MMTTRIDSRYVFLSQIYTCPYFDKENRNFSFAAMQHNLRHLAFSSTIDKRILLYNLQLSKKYVPFHRIIFSFDIDRHCEAYRDNWEAEYIISVIY